MAKLMMECGQNPDVALEVFQSQSGAIFGLVQSNVILISTKPQKSEKHKIKNKLVLIINI